MFCPVCRSEYVDDWKVCPRDAATLLGSQYIGKYRIDQMLGVGGMGAVYRAYNPDTSSSVAVKLLHGGSDQHEATRERFKREASSVAALRTRHVVSIFDFGADRDGTLYLVMEYLQGHSLRAEITPMPNTMPLPRVNFVVDETLRGLAAAHKASIVHRDLKPENLFVADTDDGEVVKVLDFGIARMQRADTPNLTGTGALMGTPAYMAPEQVAGNRGMIGRHTDVYAMGVIIYELLTGVSPFRADSLSEVLSNILTRTYAPLPTVRPDLPPAICELVEAALSEDPAKRFGSANELRDAWVKAWSQLPAEIRNAPVPQRPRPPGPDPDRAPDLGMATDIPSAATEMPRAAVAAAAPSKPPTYDERRSVTPGPVVVNTASTSPARSRTWLFAILGLVAVGAMAGVVVLSGGGGGGSKDKDNADDEPRPGAIPAVDANRVVARPLDAGAPDATPPAVAVAVPDGMVKIVGATTELGTPPSLAKGNPDAASIAKVTVPSFYLDEAEVAGPDGLPLVGLSFGQASAKCAELGKRLPTSHEWELAARDGAMSPRDAALKSGGRSAPAPVKTHDGDKTRAGVYDLLGNVSEWTVTEWPRKKGHKVVRGSGVAFAPTAGFLASIHARFAQPANKGDPVVGFRCAKDAPEP